MRIAPRLRSLLDRLRYTPLHPQWFAYRHERQRYGIAGSYATGKTLDIGCGRQQLRQHLSPACSYIGLDALTTGKTLYAAQPDIFGDAQNLPLKDRQFDTVILLEILEHLEQPEAALKNARRVVKPGGKIIVSTPFLYPVHDAPWDFQRWTEYGLQHLSKSSGTTVKELKPLGRTIETGCLIFNLALAWQTLNAPTIIRLILLPLAVVAIPTANLFAAIVSSLSTDKSDSRFANGYIMVLEAKD